MILGLFINILKQIASIHILNAKVQNLVAFCTCSRTYVPIYETFHVDLYVEPELAEFSHIVQRNILATTCRTDRLILIGNISIQTEIWDI